MDVNRAKLPTIVIGDDFSGDTSKIGKKSGLHAGLNSVSTSIKVGQRSRAANREIFTSEQQEQKYVSFFPHCDWDYKHNVYLKRQKKRRSSVRAVCVAKRAELMMTRQRRNEHEETAKPTVLDESNSTLKISTVPKKLYQPPIPSNLSMMPRDQHGTNRKLARKPSSAKLASMLEPIDDIARMIEKLLDQKPAKDSPQRVRQRRLPRAPYAAHQNPTERVNRMFKTRIIAYIEEQHNTWDVHLPELTFAYNTATQQSTKMSPAFLNMGRHPQPGNTVRQQEDEAALRTTNEEEQINHWRDRMNRMKEIHELAATNSRNAQERQASTLLTQLAQYTAGRQIFWATEHVQRSETLVSASRLVER
ncbi:unnamed protein product, partial [Trichogramma brassicae]